MRSRKRKKKYLINNVLSVLGLVLFVLAELLYFNLFYKTNFKEYVDNIPNNVKYMIDNTLFKIGNSEIIDAADGVVDELQSEDINLNIDDESVVSENNIVENIESGSSLDVSDTNESLIDVLTDWTNELESETEINTETKKYKYDTVMLDYFKDALFIGDSRMAGFEIYTRIPGAMYFCYSSASVFNIFESEDDVAPVGNIKLFDLLSKYKFGKIYIMLGINNLQTNYYNHKKQYKEALDKIKKLQPDAIIYLLANLHVTDIYDPTKPHLTNDNVNLVNEFIKGYADNVRVFYLDPNGMYDDENGNLRLELSTDNVHIHIIHYDKFLVYLLSNALVEDDNSSYIIGPMK